ncbi:class I SAM-dependent methyltransferase [cf. Phormidesmis sp. LEGE 11477]|nr:class I SAM-dependent methyltransferase [cf. Phormidesmis sp. LEGE 11477]
MGPDYSKPQLNLLKDMFLPHIPPKGRILDLCCGTGQLIQPLVEQGYQVTGLDGSEEMLSYAHKNAPQATYSLQDARTFSFSQSFDGIFSTSASLNHLMTLEDLAQVFERVYTSLNNGGIFLFDLNHPEQLTRWWRGQPTEGELNGRYAWMVTPHYDQNLAIGDFQVTVFQASNQPPSLIDKLSLFKQGLYKLLSQPRFIGLRLKLIQNLAKLEPSWQHQQLTYPVKGHSLDSVKGALEQVGFQNISLQTIDGESPIDQNHSAHFICTKPASVQPESTESKSTPTQTVTS